MDFKRRTIAGLLFAAPAALLAQKRKGKKRGAKVEQAVRDAEQKWADSTTKNDFAALESVLSNDLVYTHSTGAVDTKQAFIDNLKTGKARYESIVYENVDVKHYGKTAVVFAQGQFKTQGGPAHLKFIHVWVNEEGTWRLAAHQSLRLPN